MQSRVQRYGNTEQENTICQWKHRGSFAPRSPLPLAHMKSRYLRSERGRNCSYIRKTGAQAPASCRFYRLIIVRIRSECGCHCGARSAPEKRDEHKPDKELRQKAEQGDLDSHPFSPPGKLWAFVSQASRMATGPMRKSHDSPSELHASRQMNEGQSRNVLGARSAPGAEGAFPPSGGRIRIAEAHCQQEEQERLAATNRPPKKRALPVVRRLRSEPEGRCPGRRQRPARKPVRPRVRFASATPKGWWYF